MARAIEDRSSRAAALAHLALHLADARREAVLAEANWAAGVLREEFETEYLSSLKPDSDQIRFAIPEEMKVGRKETIKIELNRGIVADLAGIKPKDIANNVGFSLLGEYFMISSPNCEYQWVRGMKFVDWLFDVTPIRSGRHTLYLRVTPRFKHADTQGVRNIILDRQITVEMAPIYIVTRFICANWQWLGAAVILPLIGWCATRVLSP